MSRKTSFKEQMFRVLNSKNSFGQSKYLAKQESYRNGNKGKVDGIYSKKTMSDYKAVAEQFNSWQKDNGYNFHSISEVNQSVIVEYLTQRQNNGYSAWTISRDQSALNKIFNMSITKNECGLASRHSADIRNNRGLANNYRISVNEKSKDIIDLICATGIRRQSITKVTPNDFIRNRDNVIVGVRVTEKGGKTRCAFVRKQYQEKVTAFIDNHYNNKGNAPLFTSVSKNLNTHWYRAEYANGLYNDLVNAKNNGTDYFNGYRDVFVNASKLDTVTSGKNKTTKGYDSECLCMTSMCLGHNRVDVVYTNYLVRFS